MKITVLEDKTDYLKVLIEDADPATVNALRRTILGEVPTIAIDEVYVYENSSSVWDEYIAHRLAMIPLKTDLKMIPVPLTREKQNEYSVTLTLDVEGPRTVYSSDLQSSDPRVRPVSGKIPIIDLLDRQRLRLEAKAVPGVGEWHAKWQPGLASYQMLFNVDTSGCEDMKKCVDSCPRKALKLDGNKVVFDELKCNGCGECKKHGAKVEADRSRFIFFVETNGQLSAKEVLNTAIRILLAKAEGMKSNINDLKGK